MPVCLRDWSVLSKRGRLYHGLLLSKQKELRIAGNWYVGVVSLKPTPVDIHTPRRLASLEIDRTDISFFPDCPNPNSCQLTPQHSTLVLLRTAARREVLQQLQGMSWLTPIVLLKMCDQYRSEFKLREIRDAKGSRVGVVWGLTCALPTSESEIRLWSL